ncbi:MAG TPA: response regulator [Gemmatimonadales bacterium]|nr:response regulator [Gemmatimonadales bacterium]
MIIDDDADTRRALREFLVGQGFLVYTARDGQHALSMLERLLPPDLILLDYKMPVMDGKQFLAVMRRTPALLQIPVIILSAATREWSGAHLDVVEVLSKPVDLDFLLEAVNRVLTGYDAAS